MIKGNAHMAGPCTMDLQTLADSAEDVAAGFLKIRGVLPGHATEITSLMAELFAISSVLRSLRDLADKHRYRRNLPLVQSDLDMVCDSLDYTIVDTIDFFHDIEVAKGNSSEQESYRRTFVELTTYFDHEAHYPLVNRLGKYRAFLREMKKLMTNAHPDTMLTSQLREAIGTLLREQQLLLSPSSPHIGPDRNAGHPSVSVVEPGSPVEHVTRGRRGSYEWVRPAHLTPSSTPSPTMFADAPPFVPDASDSVISSSSESSTGLFGLDEHWARKVFAVEEAATVIPFEGERSKCLDRPIPDVKDWLEDQGYEELVRLTLDAKFCVSFHVREDDHRARIVCENRHFQGPSDYFCLGLNLLEVNRLGSCLHLRRRRHSGTELVLWANLEFNTYEGMVLFFCTFLAMRSQDSAYPVSSIRDYEIYGEEELFGGKIDDNGFLHALRMYRDMVSGVVRLQASVHGGDMKRVPVWTAFITPYIGTFDWLRRADEQTIYLRELNPIIFALFDYTPPVTPGGQHILSFTTPSDADAFVNNINDAVICMS